ncbi:MAG: peroxiredoxin Q/BCP [Myxococcota bacterium]
MVNPKLVVGKRAPAFTLKDDQGQRFRLTEHRGRWIIVFFCPVHTSNSCLDEVVDFNKYLPAFKEAGAFLVGISNAQTAQLEEIRQQAGLPFPLLSDKSSALATKYGAFREVKRNGSCYQTSVRATFVIDPSGKIVAMWDNCRIKGHVARVHQAFLKVIEHE